MKKFALSLLLVCLCIFSAFAVSYGIDEYRVQIVVGKNAVHSVNEDIAMNFYSAGHGFYRDIPVSFSGSPVHAKVKNFSCSEKYETSNEDDFYTVKIGDSDKKIRGVQNYTLRYDYDLGVDLNEGYDEFYFDVLGNGWECNTDRLIYEVYLPSEGLNPSEVRAWVTCGYYGADVQLDYDVAMIDGYYVLYGAVAGLKAGQAVTVRIQLPEGWYVGAREMWDSTGVFTVLAPTVSIVLAVLAYVLWSIHGKDKAPIITARFNPPENFSPMVVGYLADGSVDDKDVVSMIFHWADRGLMTINEKTKNKFTFTKLKEIEDDAPKSEKDLFNAFFRRCKIGSEQTLHNLQMNNFADAMMKAKLAVAKSFTKDKALHSKKARGYAVLTGFLTPIPLILLCASVFMREDKIDIFFPLLIVSLFFSCVEILVQYVIFKKWYLRKSNIAPCIFAALPSLVLCLITMAAGNSVVSSLICFIANYVLAVFSIIIGKRSDYGQKLFEEVLGYREFIDKVNMDELRMMIEKDPEIYYRVLSYAVVLGLEEKWSKKFKDIAVAQPSWYTGSRAIDAMYYSHMIGRMKTVVVANSVAHSASKGVGGSGFNMSGFAGGGFGGGGGRAW